jgi:hypothetical protein
MSVNVLLKMKDSGILNEDTLVRSDDEPKWIRLGSLDSSRVVSKTEVMGIGTSSVQPLSVNEDQNSNPDDSKLGKRHLVSVDQQSTNSPLDDFLTPAKWKPFLIFAGLFLLVIVFLKMIGYHDSSGASAGGSYSPSNSGKTADQQDMEAVRNGTMTYETYIDRNNRRMSGQPEVSHFYEGPDFEDDMAKVSTGQMSREEFTRRHTR